MTLPSTALRGAFSTAATPADRLAILQVEQPIIDDLTAQQQAVRTDPGAAYLALVAAHHKLDADLRSDQGQLSSLVAAAQDIAGSAQTLVSTATPAAPAKSTSTATKKS